MATPEHVYMANANYGHERILRDYCGNHDDPLYAVIPHGLVLDPTAVFDGEVQNPCTEVWSWPPVRDTAYEPVFAAAGKRTVPAAAPWLYLIEGRERREPTKGLAFFPHHSTRFCPLDCDWAMLARDLTKLPEQFQPVTVCLHINDIEKGEAKHFTRRGLEVVTCGDMHGEDFLHNLYDLFMEHRYAGSNDVSTNALYAASLKRPYLRYGDRPTEMVDCNFARLSKNVDRAGADANQEMLREALTRPLADFTGEVTDEQYALAMEWLGAERFWTPEQMRARWAIAAPGHRYVSLVNARVGHLALNTEVYLAEAELGLRDISRDRFFFGYQHVANETLCHMWARVLPVRTPPTGAQAVSLYDITSALDPNRALARTKPHLSFTYVEHAAARKVLDSWGVDGPYVCLLARDDAYLWQTFGTPVEAYAYHGYRDCDIADYVPAAEWLAEQGYHVFRMGALVNGPMPSEHPRVHDYATNGMRSDFMDIYLSATCEFFMSNGSGLDAVAVTFRRPVLYTNYMPMGLEPPYHPQTMCFGKHLLDNRGVEVDGLTNTRDRSEQYVADGLTVLDMTSDELLSATQAMVANVRQPVAVVA